MSDLLSDFLNDRIAPIPTGAVVNGIMEFDPPEMIQYSESEPESDDEKEEYVKRELNTYHLSKPDPERGGLADIDDGPEESILGSEICEQLNVPKAFFQYKFDTYYKKELPIDAFRKKILGMLSTNAVIIIHGPTGCGKTTQVPQFIMDNCRATNSPCNIVVTQPRRIAAINIAQRVCEERGWALGSVCGYQVGLDKNVGEEVILTYVTTEVLLQKLIVQRNLNRYTHIIIDEVHERSKTLDFLLLIARKYLFTNSPGVKIILMSATMEAEDFAYYFRGISRTEPPDYLLAPVLNVNKNREYTTDIYYNEQILKYEGSYNFEEPALNEEQLENCLYLLGIFDGLDDDDPTTGGKKIGSVLIFVPGIHEIENLEKRLNTQKNSLLVWEIIPLHSSLSNEHMSRAFQKPKPGTRKIILSTNIAESSVTVPDVTYVIDFCLTKIMTVNESTKFSSLSLEWASHNNCTQRAGRVGRVANGRVYRLVPRCFYETEMKANLPPELQRAPLENIILYMKLLDLNDTPKNVLSLAISPPNLKDIETCIWHLKEAGALLQTCRGSRTANDGDLTFIGRLMGNLPIDIHLSKLIILGHMFSCLEETVIMAAGCMTTKIFVSNLRDRYKCYKKKLLWADGSCSDFLIFLNLYNVWLKARRDNKFRTMNEEIAWCKMNFLNLKGLREWEARIKEINSRLKRLYIEKSVGVTRVHLSPVDKVTILKVIICGAFYPNYFLRSSDYGQVDSRAAAHTLNGRDPFQTVYFTNMKPNQPGQIYVRQIKKFLEAENNPNVHIGFDGQSSKVFVQFKNLKQPEPVLVDGVQYLTTIAGSIIPSEVYEAVRKRQLNFRFHLELLPDHEAWEFANSKVPKLEQRASTSSDDMNCFTRRDYSPLPTYDLEYMTVIVTHIVDVGHFYCQNWNEETRRLLEKIYAELNGPGVFPEPLSIDSKVEINAVKYVAIFGEDGKFYRCKVLCVTPGSPPTAQIQFVDYGNFQRVPVNRLCYLPDSPVCQLVPLALCCQLSEIQPKVDIENPRGIWSERVNNLFKRKTEGVLLNARVYSVVEDVVHLELYPHNSTTNRVSFNQHLVNENLAQKSKESHMSQMDHEKRQQFILSENPSAMAGLMSETIFNASYNDFEEPETNLRTEVIELKGPFTPLEMQIGGLVQASLGCSVKVEGDSVNAVMLDDNPDDPHSRLLVAGQVMQSGRSVKLLQTTIMPSIPGLPMLMTLLFCGQMEPKLTPDGTRIASILCGLGYKEINNKPNFGIHDISLVLDTELYGDIISRTNEVRYYMNRAVKTMNSIYDEISFPEELYDIQKKLKDMLLLLLHMKQTSVDRVNVKYADVWNKNLYSQAEILRIEMPDMSEETDIWPLLWFVKMNENGNASKTVGKNLEELHQIARRLAPEKEIICELCNSPPMTNIADIRVHLFRDAHKTKLVEYEKAKTNKE